METGYSQDVEGGPEMQCIWIIAINSSLLVNQHDATHNIVRIPSNGTDDTLVESQKSQTENDNVNGTSPLPVITE